METSLRYGGDSKALRIHAKEKLPIDSNTYFQVHGELDTRTGQPSSSSALIRHFYPNLSATLGVGLRYDQRDKLRYTVSAKKTFPVTLDGLLTFKIKGRCLVDKEFKQRKSSGAAEFSLSIFNFQKDQDLRLRLGYEVFEQGEEAWQITKCCSDHHGAVLKTTVLSCMESSPESHRWMYMVVGVPYLQIRENNWALNADYKGRWNVRFDL